MRGCHTKASRAAQEPPAAFLVRLAILYDSRGLRWLRIDSPSHPPGQEQVKSLPARYFLPLNKISHELKMGLRDALCSPILIHFTSNLSFRCYGVGIPPLGNYRLEENILWPRIHNQGSRQGCHPLLSWSGVCSGDSTSVHSFRRWQCWSLIARRVLPSPCGWRLQGGRIILV
jgi:hypothetical protein